MRRRRWLPALVLGCALLTFLNGVVVGYGSIWLQFFGEQADREDYLMSFGGYAAAALVLLIGLFSLVRLGTAQWAVAGVAVLTALLAVLAISSLTHGLALSEEHSPYQHWWDGAGGVVFLPWAWLPVALGLLAAVGRGPRSVSTADVSG
ncbi:MAG: hypothetical protein ACR2HA_07720 [Nocardioides sp.]